MLLHVKQAGGALRLALPELRRMELYWNKSSLLLDDDTFNDTGKLRVLLVGQHLKPAPSHYDTHAVSAQPGAANCTQDSHPAELRPGWRATRRGLGGCQPQYAEPGK